ncbi:MAG TPA: carbohydrate ABC transporter permease [Ruminiclostridium sp.]
MFLTNSKGSLENRRNKIYKILINGFFIAFAVCCLIPMITVISISISPEDDIMKFGYQIFPKHIDFLSYKYIFAYPKQILNAYGVTFFVTIGGTLLALLINSMAAYALSRKQFEYRNPLAFIVFFTTMFSGGLIPWYILITNYLHLSNTIWVMIIPSLASPWNMFLLRTNFKAIPDSIIESAKIDGANEMYIYYKLILPLSKPALATIGLFFSLGFWNDWWLCLLFIDKSGLFNLQYILYRMMANITYLTSQMPLNLGLVVDTSQIPNESARMATVILAAGPMLFVFTFFQKYFVQGLTVGSIKG